MSRFHTMMWDRGDAVDEAMLRFTIGDDWRMDQRLVEHDLRGSLAHAQALRRAELLSAADHEAIRSGLERLLAEYRAGDWTVEEGDEDVHSAVERRLIDSIGEPGKRLHTGRSRNEQVACDLLLWLRDATRGTDAQLVELCAALQRVGDGNRDLPLPGYTHLRRAMPSSVGHWAAAHAAAFDADRGDLESAARRAARCPLGSGSGYGVPIALDRALLARELGFEGPVEPVTFVQYGRGRAELAYLTALEEIALDLTKLAADLWLFSSAEFGYVRLPQELTTGSSLMPQKRNPDLVELLRAQSQQVLADRAALLDVLRGLPSGYHRDFQLLKPPLFRAHDRVAAMLPLAARLVDGLAWDAERLRAVSNDPALQATARALERVREGEAFRSAYRAEAANETSPDAVRRASADSD